MHVKILGFEVYSGASCNEGGAGSTSNPIILTIRTLFLVLSQRVSKVKPLFISIIHYEVKMHIKMTLTSVPHSHVFGADQNVLSEIYVSERLSETLHFLLSLLQHDDGLAIGIISFQTQGTAMTVPKKHTLRIC